MNYRALFVGLTTIDIQYFVESFPVSNQKFKTNPPEILVGGPATNAAVAFSKLNNGAHLVSATGQNPFAQWIENDFFSTGIVYSDLVKTQKVNPVIASVITSDNGDRNIFTHNPGEISPEFQVKKLFESVNPQILLIDGFYPEFSLGCAQFAKKQGIPVVIDCGSWKPQHEEILKWVDIAICSEDFYPPGCVDYSSVFDFLSEKKVTKTAISRGEKSLLFNAPNLTGEIEVGQCEVIDTLGAGDFLHGAFCYYYLRENCFVTSLKKASEIATLSCKYTGTRQWLNFS